MNSRKWPTPLLPEEPVYDNGWPYPLLTQTNGYFLKKAIWRGKPRKLSPPLIIG